MAQTSILFLVSAFLMLAGVLLVVYIIATWLLASYAVPIAVSAFIVLILGMFSTMLVLKRKI